MKVSRKFCPVGSKTGRRAVNRFRGEVIMKIAVEDSSRSNTAGNGGRLKLMRRIAFDCHI